MGRHSRPARRVAPMALLLAVLLLAQACALDRPVAPPSTPLPHRRPPPSPSCVDRTFAGLSEAQRLGQLFLVGQTGTDPVATGVAAAVQDGHVAGVVLGGSGWSGAATVRSNVQRLQSLATPEATGGVRLFVSGNQEGGAPGSLQAFYGPGFSAIPSALVQGTMDPARLRQDAATWGAELRAAGVNLDLAPVMDTVPTPLVATNAPIGALDREYGHDPAMVAAHGSAFVRGMESAGVAATVKHFPGLGRVGGNTDFSPRVVDTVTTRHDPYLDPFRAGIAAGAGFVMVSLAIYARLDAANPAVFSPVVIQQLLRGDLGFQGVVMSDDLGAAAAVQDVPAAERALRFLDAGGDLILTMRPADVGPMEGAVRSRMDSDPSFRDRVNASVRRVLAAKASLGLLPACAPVDAATAPTSPAGPA
jgi:beta-N-acetylhexosaminidase